LRVALFHYYAGEWDAAEQIVDRYRSTKRGRWFIYWISGLISIARGDDLTSDAIMAAAMMDEDRSTGLLLQATAADGRGQEGRAGSLCGDALDLMVNEPTFGTLSAHVLPLAASHPRLGELITKTPEADLARPALIAGYEGRLGESADLLASIGLPTIAARMHVVAAKAAVADGRLAEAAARADEALSFFTGVGANRYADTASELLQAARRPAVP
jgi:hypothetical protein